MSSCCCDLQGIKTGFNISNNQRIDTAVSILNKSNSCGAGEETLTLDLFLGKEAL